MFVSKSVSRGVLNFCFWLPGLDYPSLALYLLLFFIKGGIESRDSSCLDLMQI